MYMTLLTENVCHAPDNTILEPDLLPPKGPGQGAPHLKGICRKKTLDSPLWTPLDPRSSMSRRYEGDYCKLPPNNHANVCHYNLTSPGKQLITTNLSITTPDRNPFQPKPRIPKWSTMHPKVNKIPKTKSKNKNKVTKKAPISSMHPY